LPRGIQSNLDMVSSAPAGWLNLGNIPTSQAAAAET
jgi:hypothetical protein